MRPWTEPGIEPGTVMRTQGVKVQAHELTTAHRLASLGLDVEFLRNPHGRKTADAMVGGLEWE